MRETRGIRWAAGVIAFALLAGSLAGCSWLARDDTRTPDLVGVIQALQPDGASWLVTLVDGQNLRLNENRDDQRAGYTTLGPRADPDVGDLVIAGSRPQSWFYIAAHHSFAVAGGTLECYYIGHPGTEYADWVDVSTDGVSLRLTKAPDFDPIGSNGIGHRYQFGTCLDSQARVKRVGL